MNAADVITSRKEYSITYIIDLFSATGAPA